MMGPHSGMLTLGAVVLAAAAAGLGTGCRSTPGDSYYNRGVRLQGEGRLPAAVRAYREAIDDDPEDARAHYNLGTVYQEIGDARKAKAAYEAALRLRDDPRAHVNLAAILEQEGQTDEALRHLDTAVGLAEESAFPWGFRGAFHERRGDAARARADFLAGIEAEPEDASCHLRLGQLLRREGKHDEARRSIDEAAGLDPRSRPAWRALGELAREMGDTPGAIRAYERLATLSPDRVATFVILGELYLERGQPARASLALERAVLLAPPALEVRRLRLRAYLDQLSAELEAAREEGLPAADLERIDARLADLRRRLEPHGPSAEASPR